MAEILQREAAVAGKPQQDVVVAEVLQREAAAAEVFLKGGGNG